MRVKPAGLNASIATLFMVGAAGFVVGSVPAYANAVGGVGDAVTYFIGSIFFTAASYLQLVQAQSPSTTEVDAVSQHTPVSVSLWSRRPQDRAWLAAVTQFPGTLFFNISTLVAIAQNASVQAKDRHVWRPDAFGSTLFLVASVFGLLAVGRLLSFRPRSLPWWIAWLNMVGSILFMASALASYVLPSTGALIDVRLAVLGTLLGAACFLIGAALLLPAWTTAISKDHRPARPVNNL